MVQYKYEEKKKVEKVKHQYKKAVQVSQQVEDDGEGFPILDEGAECPICYEPTGNDCYSTCKTCKNSIHSKCLKVWSQYK